MHDELPRLALPTPSKTPKFMKNLLRRCALVALLGHASAGHVLAATYFVNSNGGNDSYSGTYPVFTTGVNGPWQTLAKLANVSLAPNDTVYLACGGTWQETLRVNSSGATNLPITIAAGPGTCVSAPTIDGAIAVPPHGWTQYNGSIYRAKLPPDLIANPSPSASLNGWTHWASTGDAMTTLDSNCPERPLPCMAFVSGSSASLAISNTFPLAGGADYFAGVQLRAPVGVPIKVVLRRAVPPYDSFAPVQWVTGVGTWQSVGVTFRAGMSVANARMDIEVLAPRIRLHLVEAHVRQQQAVTNVLATYVDGVQIRRSHHPNFGQGGNANSPYGTLANPGGKTTLDTAGLALPPDAQLTIGLVAAMRTVNWAIEERVVASVSGSRLSFSPPTRYETNPGYGYYLTGALWMLDSPGEWYFDAAASMLYVWMPNGGPPGGRVAVSNQSLGADLAGKANVALKDIAFRRVGTGVNLDRSAAVVVSGIRIEDTADNGISAKNCSKCSIRRSHISRTGLDAIYAAGALAADFELTDSVIVDSASSRRLDGWRTLPRPSDAAVFAVGARSSILRNSIEGSGNLGIYLGVDGVVSNNYIVDTCLTVNDCGAIYANFNGKNSNIGWNVIESVVGNLAGMPRTFPTHTVGIYIDDRNSGSRIWGNTVTGADYGIQLHNANQVTVDSNILFGNRRYQLWLQEKTGIVRSAGDVFDNLVKNNKLVPTANGPALFLQSTLGDTTDFASFIGNHYSALLSPRIVAESSPSSGERLYSLLEWQSELRETDGVVTAPVGYAPFFVGSANMVPNGNLVNGLAGWSLWNLTPPLATVSLSNCGFAPCVRFQAGASPSLLSTPNFSIVAGQWYRVTFDAATSREGQPIYPVVRRGGGGSANYDYVMGVPEAFVGSTAWRRYSFSFQATKTVTAGDPVTRESGARIDFERNLPGTALTVARVEIASLIPAQVAGLQISLLLNRQPVDVNIGCPTTVSASMTCGSLVYWDDNRAISWPTQIGALSGRPVYARDTSVVDQDGDAIADTQDACPNTPAGMTVNLRGCAFSQ